MTAIGRAKISCGAAGSNATKLVWARGLVGRAPQVPSLVEQRLLKVV
ncbi:MAG TPA: hypothetical protein VJ036_07690 [bacterium]|jgi:hypothetical protein|nr:hypothetical protein [bacterium]